MNEAQTKVVRSFVLVTQGPCIGLLLMTCFCKIFYRTPHAKQKHNLPLSMIVVYQENSESMESLKKMFSYVKCSQGLGSDNYKHFFFFFFYLHE